MKANVPRQSWDALYCEKKHNSIWPWSDLVGLVMRYSNPRSKRLRVLELGCGAGANIPLFVSLNADYFSVESSKTIVSELHAKFPQLKDSIVHGDFTENLPDQQFDLIVDRGALTSNTTSSIQRCLVEIFDRLEPGGTFIGVDWYSTECTAFHQAQKEDKWTRVNFTDKPFVGVPRIHFSDKQHICDLFSDFDLDLLEHKLIRRELVAYHSVLGSWNLVARKKSTEF